MQLENIVLVKIELIIPNPNQPRKIFNDDSLNELATSIKQYGILNPILVRKKDNLYEIVAGERRYRAAKIAGLTEVPVIIKNIDDKKLSEIALTENLQRENITPIEEANTYAEILKNTNITEQQLSKMIGKSQPSISNKLRLLKLPTEIQEALNNKKISEKHARSLLTISDSTKQIELLKKIINEKLSVKELDNIINNQKEEKESDNMNGNFFPNYNNGEQNNNVSLNQMNMQTMNMSNEQPQVAAPSNEQIIPQSTGTELVNNNESNVLTGSLPQVEIQNMNMEPNSTPVVMPEMNNDENSSIPDFGMNISQTATPTINEPVENILPSTMNTVNETNTIVENNNMPIFGEPTNVTVPVENTPIQESPMPQMETNTIPNTETPLFNQELNTESTLNETFYEVPVNVSPVIEEPKEDKFTNVSQLLSSNNIEYKAYSNETGHCIIIEL